MIYRELSAGEFNDLASRILYEDNHLLVVNKKVGEIVQGDKTGDTPLSEMVMREYLEDSVSPTVSASMLKPRRVNIAVTRVKTPALFST